MCELVVSTVACKELEYTNVSDTEPYTYHDKMYIWWAKVWKQFMGYLQTMFDYAM